ncbi:MAG: DUF4926 domain-containing protein [Alphaproteobacteria bacterium]
MSNRVPKLLDVVALLRDLPNSGLHRGQVGTVVEAADGDAVLVEFADAEGRTVALPQVPGADLLVLDYGQAAAE